MLRNRLRRAVSGRIKRYNENIIKEKRNLNKILSKKSKLDKG